MIEQHNVHRPLRFGVLSHNTTPDFAALLAQAQRAEQLGYSTFLLPDHIGDQFATTLALASIAAATTRLRVGSYVFANDFRHPVMLAREVATLDVLSGGRFELGLGAGWMASEYQQCGIPFASPAVRIERLSESLQIIKALLAGERLSFSGQHYRIEGLALALPPQQRPYPPILIGGSGKRLLSLAAREASIVGFSPRTQTISVAGHMNQSLDLEDALAPALAEKVLWVRQAAGPRFASLELNLIVLEVILTSERQQALAEVASRYHLAQEQVANTPYFLIGSPEEICTQLQHYRQQYHISYWVVWEEYMEALAPVVAMLSGQ
ncbi:TIGR03621 family F420-dependent LLM class oxidoreductase [Thermogemmatispora sp.]|uniref:TIGR03621 family F420-dependent LLM class oxidoreductase n=1 Tax=Thermogemmatispora sp. TaxID=1968838 RepID=UPI0035E45437